MSTNRAPYLPTTNDLVQISKQLNDEPISKVLSDRKTIPRILLTAAKRGIKENSTAPVSGTKALVDSLLSFSKASIIAKQRNQNIRKPSPFSKTRAAHLDKTEIETITRAATWATKLLTDCIRGVLDPAHTANPSPVLASVTHRDISAVFVAPRDKLDAALAQRYANHATHSLRHPFFRNNLSALSNVEAFLLSTATASSDHINLYLPVLERALLTFGSAPCPLLASEQSYCTLERALEQSLGSPDPQSDVLALLSPEAKGILCVQSSVVRASLRAHIEQVFSSQKTMPYITERETINPLARAAVIDMDFHWELMDQIRTLVSGREAPFSLRLWNQRRFFRALFSEILLLIGKGENYEFSHAKFVRRFPPFGRPVVQILSKLSGSMQSQDARRQRMAISMAGELICKLLNVGHQIVWTPNVHALMICAESLLELFCWAATFSLESDVFEPTLPRKRTRRRSREHDTLMCVCYLSSLMETSRLPGGRLVEMKAQLQSTISSTRKFLLNVFQKNQLDLAVACKEKRIGGLNAFALSGILGRQDLDVSVTSCGTVLSEDKECLSRSLEKCMLWTTDATIHSRYSRHIKLLVDSVR